MNYMAYGTSSIEDNQFAHEVLEISRVVRVVKGGRRFRFRASVIVGDRAGKLGFGISKSKDVQQAIQKAQAQAMKKIVTVQVVDGTITHEVTAKFKGAEILLKPARPGTGVIAGGVIRTIADLAGIKDLVSKRYGSVSRISNARAVLKALQHVA